MIQPDEPFLGFKVHDCSLLIITVEHDDSAFAMFLSPTVSETYTPRIPQNLTVRP